MELKKKTVMKKHVYDKQIPNLDLKTLHIINRVLYSSAALFICLACWSLVFQGNVKIMTVVLALVKKEKKSQKLSVPVCCRRF